MISILKNFKDMKYKMNQCKFISIHFCFIAIHDNSVTNEHTKKQNATGDLKMAS